LELGKITYISNGGFYSMRNLVDDVLFLRLLGFLNEGVCCGRFMDVSSSEAVWGL
jgi:hypothetical protein